MNPNEIRARLGQISERLKAFDGAQDFSEDEMGEISALNDEFEGLTGKLETAEKIENMKAKAATSTRKSAPATSTSSPPRVEVGASATDKFGGFKSTGEFLSAVKRHAAGDVDKRFQNVMYEKNGEDGGFMVPEEMNQTILKKLQVQESILSATRQFQISGNTLSLNLDESQPWNNGVQAYWVAEGAPITESKQKFTGASWRLHKLGALVKATDELLEDVTALESYIQQAAPEAIMYKINDAILTGDGAGKPTGMLNSPFTLTVPKEPGQASDSIVYQNIIKMYSRMLPGSRANANWYMNAGVEEQLLGITDGNGRYIYLSPGSQLNQTPYGQLMGRPVVPLMSGLPGLGTSGDILFADPSYYYTILKASGVKSAVSIHLHFDRDITSYKFTMRIDGSVPFKTPVTTEFGSYQMSAIVKLADRP